MTLAPGQSVSYYEILGSIGAGGMGEVWRARDTRLDREVAIKILPDAFADDEDRMRRFEREAKTLASLSHPNIAQIFEIGQDGDTCYIVLELVRGEDLSERIDRGPMSVDEALDVARQICEGLVAAHDSGVVHRDLKPANVRVMPDGTVKLLDFGLAKPMKDGQSGVGTSTPDSFLLTEAGMVLGTPTYMSPEQARGKAIDRRTDIWAFGCVLYECLTGRRAFGGDALADIIAAIVEHDVELKRLPASTPPRIVELLRRTLTKDPRKRLQHLGDARLEIELAQEGVELVAGASPSSSRAPWMFAGILVGAIAGWGAFGRGGSTTAESVPAAAVSRVSVPIPESLITIHPRLAPDGRSIVYRGAEADDDGEPRSVLFFRRLDSTDAVRLPGTENPGTVAFAPDGNSIIVVISDERASMQLTMVRVILNEGAPRAVPIGEFAPDPNLSSGLAWTDQDELVVTGNRGRLLVMSLEDREWREMLISGDANPDDYTPDLFRALPGGRHVLAHSHTYGPEGFSPLLLAVDLETGHATKLVKGGYGAWSETGHLLYTVGEILYAVGFDPETLTLSGAPQLLFGGLRTSESWRPAWFDVSRNGTLIHEPGGIQGEHRSFVLVSEDGEVEPWSDDARAFDGMSFVSHDGSFLAVAVVATNGLVELWGSEVEAPLLRPFLTGPAADFMPGPIDTERRLLYFTRRTPDGTDGIWRAPMDEPERAEPIWTRTDAKGNVSVVELSRDGKTLFARRLTAEGAHIVSITLDGDPPVFRDLFEVSSDVWGARISPDDRWLAYADQVNGRKTAVLREWRSDGSCGPPIPVPLGRDIASWVEWSRSAPSETPTMVIPLENADRLVEVEILSIDPLRFSEPRFRATVTRQLLDYDTLPDGRLLILKRADGEEAADRIEVVLGFSSLID